MHTYTSGLVATIPSGLVPTIPSDWWLLFPRSGGYYSLGTGGYYSLGTGGYYSLGTGVSHTRLLPVCCIVRFIYVNRDIHLVFRFVIYRLEHIYIYIYIWRYIRVGVAWALAQGWTQFWPSLGPDVPLIPLMWNCLALFGPRFVLTFAVQVRTRSCGCQQVHSGAQKVAHRDGDNSRPRV